MLTIFIDADACPVKDETYKVAARYSLKVFVIANQWMQIPLDPKIEMVIVEGGFDSADDWIVEHIEACDILITSDLLLADRCLKKKARVLGSKGKELDEENIGNVLGARELMSHLRDLGSKGTGPKPMTKVDRSQFLSKLDQIIQALKKVKLPTSV